MDYKKLKLEVWDRLDESGDFVSGYHSILLAADDTVESGLHIFKDENGYYHFAIEIAGVSKNDIKDPQVNGLQIGIFSYRLKDEKIGQFVDIICSTSGYLEEFTEVVKEISSSILDKEEKPLDAINQTIRNWISFWTKQKTDILSEEEQIGLICELLILETLCNINASNALQSWGGPKGEKHDFTFTDWSLEVKGTRHSKRIHKVNGIDQLKSAKNKRLAFVSFLLTTSGSNLLINLPSLIESISKKFFIKKPDLLLKFNELLASSGYSPIHAEVYCRFNLEIVDSGFFEVDGDFPKLTSDMLSIPLSSRISSVSYDISLDGIGGKKLDVLSWGNYFY